MPNKTKATVQGCQRHNNHYISQDNLLIEWANRADLIQSFGPSLACLRWRRLISPFTAMTINCAFVSPSSRLLSNSATTSCGKRALSCCDLLLVEPVAITGTPCIRCDSVYAKKVIMKDLKCDSLLSYFKNKGAIHLVNAKPGSGGTLTRLLTTTLIEVTIMAGTQSTQIHPKFTWCFLAVPVASPDTKPMVLHTSASSETEARRTGPDGNCSSPLVYLYSICCQHTQVRGEGKA